ncbi:MAG TPA: sigma-54-dependent Fis family transcriptional regulator [Candidatus Merdimorpha stercoravium]|uniref:Sigma-54-dependent Fis family transcriptional regulator n=1 Tax=Candidatus Merdimorpha stercoravium TaxID=2840863 RepID=A0A9D1H8W2_9FLAO|nr:sigma-54-dependent Fis family transcriptional regulator [Candidatus Merdimorpha stercoravium]
MAIDIQEIKQRFGIIGNSPALNRAIEKAAIVAPTDISALVTGESGVGKENIPRIIHSLSYRKHKPYIAVNCGAIPEGTIESELFGHEKGAFTGAAGVRKGYFEVADGGTIFLDEVGELPLMTQVRLLRVLETGEFMKVGSSQTQRTDVRIVAATNRNLIEAIDQGRFREDLYYRLNTVEISLPPLRGRREDIFLLWRKFSADFAEKYKIPPARLSDDAVEFIQSYDWPGNIRQLRNFTEQLSIMESNRYVDASTAASYLPPAPSGSFFPQRIASQTGHNEAELQLLAHSVSELRGEVSELKRVVASLLEGNRPNDFFKNLVAQAPAALPSPKTEEVIPTPHSLSSIPAEKVIDLGNYEEHPAAEEEPLALEKNEIEMIRKALERHRSKRKDAARELGISERTLYRKIKQYGLQ